MTSTTTPGFTEGQEVIWTGQRNQLSRRVRITEVAMAYLNVGGKVAAGMEPVYDLVDPLTGDVQYGIPGDQLHDPAGTEG